jgi:hypothetical protein
MGTAAHEPDDKPIQHTNAIETLSRDLQVPKEEVARVYQAVLARMAGKAKIKDYLSIFVSRHVKCVLKEGQHGDPAACELADLLK